MPEMSIQIGKEVADAMRKAMVRALNKTVAKAKTASSKEVRKIYNIKAGDLNSKTKKYNANKNKMYAGFYITSRYGLKMLYFSAKDVYPGGVDVKIKMASGVKTLPHVFIARMPSGHINVFRSIKGEYTTPTKGKYAGKKGRSVVEGLYSVDPVKMYEKHGQKMVGKTFVKEYFPLFKKQLDFELSQKVLKVS